MWLFCLIHSTKGSLKVQSLSHSRLYPISQHRTWHTLSTQCTVRVVMVRVAVIMIVGVVVIITVCVGGHNLGC